MSTLQVAIVQAAPVSLAIGDGIDMDGRSSHSGESEDPLFAHVDFHDIDEGLASLDANGHYSRPNVFAFHVLKRSKDGVKWGAVGK